MVPRSLVFSFLLVAAISSRASADFSTGSTGVDGAFHPTSNVVVDLSTAGTGPGTGTYDPVHWAIVFNHSTIDIPGNVTVTFKNHPSGAPVIWLAQGDVTISGAVNLDGAAGGGYYNEAAFFAEPGPGGFQGGRREIDPNNSRACAGFGPGGALFEASGHGGGGGYGTVGGPGTSSAGGSTYGDEYILPLIGGSGGAAGFEIGFPFPYGGGAGGGAILIASPTSIVLNGQVTANGGIGGAANGGPGSGGAIRLRAPSFTGMGILRAVCGVGSSETTYGLGRIRVEASTISVVDVGVPLLVGSTSPNPIFPDATAPTLIATMIGTTPIPPDPSAGIETIDAVVGDIGLVTLHIAATNIPVGTVVDVILVPDGGTRITWTSTPLAGTLSSSTATATFPMDRIRRTDMILRAETVAGPVTHPLSTAGAR